MQRAAAGDQDAVREILEEYGDGVLFAVRRILSPKLRSQFDAVDLRRTSGARCSRPLSAWSD